MNVTTAALDLLRPHPRNYRAHPPDQVREIAASLKQHGFYRPLVVARDGTILAGHGLALAAESLGYAEVPVIVLPLDPGEPRALKVLAGDNMLSHLSLDDDRALTEMLREIAATDDLLGTGLDEQQLAALAFVTRSAAELKTKDHAADWVGLPDYEGVMKPLSVIVCFEDAETRERFMAELGATVINKKTERVYTIWWPEKPKDDLASVRYVDGGTQ